MTTHQSASDADPHPHQAASDEADPEKQSTPAGVAKDLEQEAEAIGASTDSAPPPPKDESPKKP